MASSSLSAPSGSSPKWTASMPTARAASTLSRLSSTNTPGAGTPARRWPHGAEGRAGEAVDARVGLAHADLARVDHDLEQLVDRERRPPRRTELLHVVREQGDLEAVATQPPDPVDDGPVDAEGHVLGELLVGVEVDRPAQHLRRSFHDAGHVLLEADLTRLEPVPVVRHS